MDQTSNQAGLPRQTTSEPKCKSDGAMLDQDTPCMTFCVLRKRTSLLAHSAPYEAKPHQDHGSEGGSEAVLRQLTTDQAPS